jgi:hydrogenase maturation protease
VTALIIGFGNPDRGDDAAGPMVARLLAGRVGARVLERHGDALALLSEWQAVDTLVLVDAAAPMGAPGRIHRLDLAEADLPCELATGSTHAFGLPEAVALSRRLGTLPARTLVYAIEGTCFDPGAAVCPAVTDAVAQVARELAERPGALPVARRRAPDLDPAKGREAL